ncbi:MAG: hypothetical protein P8X74_00510 [Reinekea sp.]
MLSKNWGEPMGAPAIFEKQIEIKLFHPASTLESRIQEIFKWYEVNDFPDSVHLRNQIILSVLSLIQPLWFGFFIQNHRDSVCMRLPSVMLLFSWVTEDCLQVTSRLKVML